MKFPLAALGVVVALLPARGLAFSDPERFLDPARQGGGGGRMFTGSPSDGYTCAVCHTGERPAEAIVRGLPVDGYVPGQTYDVEVTWPPDGIARAVAVELSGLDNRAAGTSALLSDAELPITGRCGQNLNGGAAGYVQDVVGRRVLGLEDCGALALRFRWTAPAEGGVVLFAGAIVSSDKQGDPQGDGVTELDAVLVPQGETLNTSTGCYAGGSRTHGGLTALALLAGALGWRRRTPWRAR